MLGPIDIRITYYFAPVGIEPTIAFTLVLLRHDEIKNIIIYLSFNTIISRIKFEQRLQEKDVHLIAREPILNNGINKN